MWLLNLLSALTVANPEGPPQALSLDEAVAMALARSPALAGALASGEASAARVEAAEASWLPKLTLEARYRYLGPVPELTFDTGLTLPGQSEPLVMRRELGSEHNAEVAVSAAWRALDFGVRAARVDAAKGLARAAERDAEVRMVEVAYATRVAYLGMLLAEEGARTTDAALALARATRDDLSRRRSAGLASDLGLAGAELRIAELEARAIDANEGVTRSRDALATLIGRSASARDTLEGVLVDQPAPLGSEHPSLTRLRATEEAFEAQALAARRSHLPTLDLLARAGVQSPATLVDTDEAGVAWLIGVSLTWDLYDGGRRSAEAKEAEARAREVRRGHQALAEELARTHSEAEARRDAAVAQLATAERRLRAAETYLVAARGALDAGTGRTTDLQAAEVGLDEARLARARALHQRALAEAQRRRALGLTIDLAAPKEITP